MRLVRVFVVVLGATLLLATSAVAATPQQISLKMAESLVGSHFSGGPNVQVSLHRLLRGRQYQLVVNDCNTAPQPPIGWWYFKRSRIQVLNCSQQVVLAPPNVAPYAYHLIAARNINYACQAVRDDANRKQPYGKNQRIGIPCQSVDRVSTLQFVNHQLAPAAAVDSIDLDYVCTDRYNHNELRKVTLWSGGALRVSWCDGSSRTLRHRNL